ncbi:MAG: hypothetical protein KatS3mg057_1006 [Herpetosiphonaceae bacterium]|nr:MAG: hypothetical protein KatS3mg057_1006 [Herpetosiphonaceae bacterium]
MMIPIYTNEYLQIIADAGVFTGGITVPTPRILDA